MDMVRPLLAVVTAAGFAIPGAGLPRVEPGPVVVQGRLEEARVPGPSLAGNLLREPSVRHAVVYLPPSYDRAEDRRYPVVYLLHAFGVGPASWLGVGGYEGMDLAETLDSLIDEGEIDEAIVVMPDARTRSGGSWYTNSPTTGRWTDFIARDLVAFVDRAYRTVPASWGRGVAGQSMGGYGALRVAMWYPDVFGAVLALSSPNLVTTNPFGRRGMELALAVGDLEQLETASPVARVLWAKAMAFSPDPGSPPLYGRLPWTRRDGRLVRDPGPWEDWSGSVLVNQLEDRAQGLRGMPIRLEVGSRDPLIAESETFSEALRDRGITHGLERFQGDHVIGVRTRFERGVFQFFTRHLSDSLPTPPTGR